MKIRAISDVGSQRDKNQDSFILLKDKTGTMAIFGVADGLGGHNGGEVASKLVATNLKDYFEKNTKSFEEVKKVLKAEIVKINEKILKRASRNKKLEGMGTTLSLCVAKEEEIYILHVGDSRCYKINNEKIEQITIDHSLVSSMVEMGEITKDEALIHPSRNVITNALGTSLDFFVDNYDINVSDDDVILVCSDGLTEHLSDEEIKNIVMTKTLDEAREELIDLANQKGGSDNITVVLYTRGRE